MRSPAVLVLLLVVACGIGPSAQTTTSTSISTTTNSPVTTTVPDPEVGSCSIDPAFVDRGQVAGLDQAGSDTNSLGLISWQVEGGCERFGIDFETAEGAPATTPPAIAVEFLEARNVLRVRADVDETGVTDQLVETPLVDRLYVVRALDGGMFVDFHLARAAQARVAISSSPASLTIELQAGADPLGPSPSIADRVVVTTPTEGEVTGTIVEVGGYARTFEANVLIIATAAGEVVAETNTTAAEWTETWGQFRASIRLPIGETSLFVGEESPEDGRLVGVTLDLLVR
ncbi:MAG: Gmad2 immunoglobulin-like domain-containing protein [Acidimicrobiia bacterium]